jgi:recombination protein RecA
MSQAMRKLTAFISKTKCVCIFTNQIREKIGVMFGNPETTPGGRALKFFSSSASTSAASDADQDPRRHKVIGNRTKIKIVKNKVAPPFTEANSTSCTTRASRSLEGSLLDLGIEHKILEKKGAWIAYQGELVGQGRDAAKILEKVTVTGGTVVKDVLSNVAGVSPSVGDGQRDQVYIRGFVATNDEYVDGVRDSETVLPRPGQY